jgi:hypothetical protein
MKKQLRKSQAEAAAFVRQGGIAHIEAEAAAEAAQAAIKAERRRWLPVLQGWLKAGGLAPDVAAAIAADVKRLRRRLGLPLSVKYLRERNRLRVQAHRERQRKAAAAERSKPE